MLLLTTLATTPHTCFRTSPTPRTRDGAALDATPPTALILRPGLSWLLAVAHHVNA